MKTKLKKILLATLIIGTLFTLVPLNATESFEYSLYTSSEKLLETEELEPLQNSEQTEKVDANEIKNSESENNLEKIDSSFINSQKIIEQEDISTVADDEVETLNNITITAEKNFSFNRYNSSYDGDEETWFQKLPNNAFKLKLKQNGIIVSEKYIEIQKENNSYKRKYLIDFGEWPLYDENGNKYNYELEEEIKDSAKYIEYYRGSTRVSCNTSCNKIETNVLNNNITFGIYNLTGIVGNFISMMYYDRTFYVYKEWAGEYSSETRPSSISFNINGNGQNRYSTTISVDKKTTTQFVGSYNVHSYNYSDTYDPYIVTESDTPGYTMSWRVVGDNIYIKNTYKQNREIVGQKTWVGDSESDRPTSIKVFLLQNGTRYLETTTNASKDWKYSFDVPVLDDNGNPFEYSVEEETIDGYDTTYKKQGYNGLAITFNKNCEFYYSTNSEGIGIYYKKDDILYEVGKYGNGNLAGQTIFVPSMDVYFYVYTQSTYRYYGYSIDSIEPCYIFDEVGTQASRNPFDGNNIEEKNGNDYPESNHYPYLSISGGMHYDYYHYKYGDDTIGDFYYNEPTKDVFDIINTKNGNVEKKVNLHFNKIISSENEAFEKLELNKNDSYNFFITLENQETGDIIRGLVNNKEGFTVNNMPIGTYIIKELDGIWFSFINMALNESIEGIEFKEESGNYIISIRESVESGTTANIYITNKTDDERFYDNKYDAKNLFNPIT